MPLAKLYLLLAAAMQSAGLSLRWAVGTEHEREAVAAKFAVFTNYEKRENDEKS